MPVHEDGIDGTDEKDEFLETDAKDEFLEGGASLGVDGGGLDDELLEGGSSSPSLGIN